MKILADKVAVITGAARGIGEAIALKFAEHGAHVAFTYVSDSSTSKAEALEEKLKAIAQVLASFGLLETLPKRKQEQLLKAIYEILVAPEL